MTNTASNMDQIPSSGSKIDFQAIINRAKDMCAKPDSTLEVVKSEPTSIPDIYKNYLIFVAAIYPIASWLKFSVIGFSSGGVTFRVPLFRGLMHFALEYIVSLAMIYVTALIMEKVAPKFEGTASLEKSFKLLAYSMTPAMIAGALLIIPSIGWIAVVAGAAYGIYIVYNNFSKFVEVPELKRPTFIVVSVVCMVVIYAIAFSIVEAIFPTQGGGTINIGNQTIDLDEMEKGLKEWEKRFPKP